MADSSNRCELEFLFRRQKNAIKTTPTNIGPLKKGGLFGKLTQLKAQRDALDYQIKMIEDSQAPLHIGICLVLCLRKILNGITELIQSQIGVYF
jgi:hypothetical protein